MGRWHRTYGTRSHDGSRGWLLRRFPGSRLHEPNAGPQILRVGPRLGVLGHRPPRMGPLGLGKAWRLEVQGTFWPLVVKPTIRRW